MKLADVRIAQVWVSPVTAQQVMDAPAPANAGAMLSDISVDFRYPILFEDILYGGFNDASAPWPTTSSIRFPKTNRFWRKYLISHMVRDEESWEAVAWQRLTPLRLRRRMLAPDFGEQPSRIYCEAYCWPTAVGLSINAWFRNNRQAIDLRSILEKFRKGPVQGENGPQSTTAFAHDQLRKVAGGIWTGAMDGIEARPVLIISVVKASAPSIKSTKDGLKDILKICSEVLGENLTPAGVRGEGQMFVGRNTVLVWDPSQFEKEEPIHTLGCLHRNLAFASMQMETVAVTAEMLAAEHKRAHVLTGSLANRPQQILGLIQEFESGATYAPPSHTIHFARPSVQAAIKQLSQP